MNQENKVQKALSVNIGGNIKKIFFMPFTGNKSKKKLEFFIDQIFNTIGFSHPEVYESEVHRQSISEFVHKRCYVLEEFSFDVTEDHLTIRSKNSFSLEPKTQCNSVILADFDKWGG